MSQPKRTVNRVAPREPEPKENRDPNNMNDHLKVDFYSVLAEPPTGPQSVTCTWDCSEVFFDCCFECWYKLMSLFCGVCFAIYWAFQFVPVIFSNIWLFTPCRSLLRIVCGLWCRSCIYLCASCAIDPCARACGLLFYHIGYEVKNPPEMPPLFDHKPRKRPPPKPVVKEEAPARKDEPTAVVVSNAGEFDDYDKEKIAKSVKRTMMFY